jgi:carbon starvation protein CstA
VGEPHLAGRTGGGVSLAVGIAQIFGNFPGLKTGMSYFYHFVIMFEALFVLTTIDTGTRIARFLVQEFGSRLPKSPAMERNPGIAWGAMAAVVVGCLGTLWPLVAGAVNLTGYAALAFMGLAVAGALVLARHPHVGKQEWIPGTIAASVLVVAGWSYFIYTGTIQTLWPMFGVANQLLAMVALVIGTTVIINEGRSRYAWVTLAPLAFVGTTTLAGGFLSIKDIFIPMALKNAKEGDMFKGYLNSGLTVIMMLCVVAILIDAIPRWRKYWAEGRNETRESLEVPAGVSASPSF